MRFGSTTGPAPSATSAGVSIDPMWRRPLAATALAILALVLLFARDATDMAAQWWHISTYQHCLYVLPITAWLVWLR